MWINTTIDDLKTDFKKDRIIYSFFPLLSALQDSQVVD